MTYPYNVPSGQDTVRNIWEVFLCLVSTVAITHVIMMILLQQSFRALRIIALAATAVATVAAIAVAAAVAVM